MSIGYRIGRIRGIIPGMLNGLTEQIMSKLSEEDIRDFIRIEKKLVLAIDSSMRENAIKRIGKTKSLTKQARKDIMTICPEWWDNENFDFEKQYKKIKHES